MRISAPLKNLIDAFSRRGLPMSIFALTAIGGTGIGPVYAGWMEMNSRLEWKWIQWIQMMFVARFLSFKY